MKKKTVLVIGVLGILLVFGAAVALAQNTSDEKTKDAENHECTPEMMENMSEMMGCSSPRSNTEAEETDHCGDMNSDMGSMMGSSGVDMRSMM